MLQGGGAGDAPAQAADRSSTSPRGPRRTACRSRSTTPRRRGPAVFGPHARSGGVLGRDNISRVNAVAPSAVIYRGDRPVIRRTAGSRAGGGPRGSVDPAHAGAGGPDRNGGTAFLGWHRGPQRADDRRGRRDAPRRDVPAMTLRDGKCLRRSLESGRNSAASGRISSAIENSLQPTLDPTALPGRRRHPIIAVSRWGFSVGRGPGVDWVLPDPKRLLSQADTSRWHFAAGSKSSRRPPPI